MLLPVAFTPHAATLAEPDASEIDYPAHLLSEWRVSPDKDGLLFSPVTFTGTRIEQEAVTSVTALVLDYDDGTPPEDAVEPWAPFDFVIYTTFNHRRVKPPKYNGEQRYRIVIPLAAPLEPAAFRSLWAWAAARAPGRIDRTCKDLFRRYYWPSHEPGAPDVFALHNAGRLLAYDDVPEDARTKAPAASRLGTKAGVLASLATLPRPAPPVARGGLFAGISEARADGTRPPAESIEEIEAKCSFMAHARDDADALPEPEWYAALSVYARCRDGETVAHVRSAPHPGYSEDDTTAKLERARARGPATCAHVSAFYDGCKACPHFGRITSPAQLGSPDPVEAPDEAAERAASDLEDARTALATARARVETARLGLKEAQRQHRYIVDAEEQARACEPARHALEAAIEDRDRAGHVVKGAERKARELEANATPPDDADADVWRALKLNPATSAPVPCYSNVYKIARLDPLLGPNMRTNMLGDVPEWGGKPVEDNDLSVITEYLADSYGLEARLSDVKSAVSARAGAVVYNPAAEYLQALAPWDGTPRAAWLLREVLHVEDGAEGLYATYLQKFMVAAVRRAMTPGVKVDTMLVLQGAQALKKSTFFAVLFGAKFVHDTKFDISDKDSYGQIAHGWLYEWAELSGLSRKAIEEVKNFLSSVKDTYRSPYAHFARVHYRHTVFGGTTNDATPLNDPTGARRFWIIPIDVAIDLELLAEYVDQLWAEALARASSGELHYLDDTEAALQRADSVQFEEEDPRAMLVKRWLDRRGAPFHTAEVCIVLGLAPDLIGARVVGRLLRSLGCTNRPLDGGAVRLWCPPGYDARTGTMPANVVPVKFGATGANSRLFSGGT